MLAPNGIPFVSATTDGPASLDAIGGARDDGSVLLLGQATGAGPEAVARLAEQPLPAGTFVAALNANAQPLWIRHIGSISPNAPLTRLVSSAGAYGFVAADMYTALTWGQTTLRYDGTPYVALLRFGW